MSTNYPLSKRVAIQELFDSRLESLGIVEYLVPDKTKEERRCLTDGRNFLWASGSEEDLRLTRYMPNGAPRRILRAIAEAFDTEIFSEYQPQYWGFDTQAEWDAVLDAMEEKGRDEFYEDLIKYVRNEPSGLGPGTVGEKQAQIAKTLVEERPELALPGAKEELLAAIDAMTAV